MSRRKKNIGRKGRALRSLGWLLVIAALASALKLYCFLPIQAIRNMADTQDVENPRVVERFYDGTLPVTRTALHYLVDGDRSMMLCVTGYNVFMGWYDRSFVPVETWDDNEIHAGLYIHQQDERRVVYLFGKIEDESIVRLTMEGFSTPEFEDRVAYSAEIPPEDIFEKDGERYFISKLDGEVLELPQFLYDVSLTGFDLDGNAVSTVEVLAHSWST